MAKRALILGASGLVGGHLLARLLEDDRYGEVRALVRRALATEHPKLRQVVVDFERMDQWGGEIEVDHVFCCLGTTIWKARSRRAFARVDHDYPLEAARLAARHGVGHFAWISAAGANQWSPFFYPRIKGRLEADIARVGLQAWTAVRPSMLLGKRRELRLAEEAAKVVAPLVAPALLGPMRKYRPIHADRVAAGMIACANGEAPDQCLEVVQGRS